MHRLTPILVAVGALALLFVGLGLTSYAAPRPAARPAAQQADEIDIYMSNAPDGVRQRSFLSNTTVVYAIVAYEGAASERFQVRHRDLSGIIVKEQAVGPVSGSGTASVAIRVTDFVNTYRSTINSHLATYNEKLDEAVDACLPENIPPVPPVWPPQPTPVPTRGPGTPMPTPGRGDPYSLWVQATLEAVEVTRSATADITRTLQAALALPDVQALPDVGVPLSTARQAFIQGDQQLKGVSVLLAPAEAGKVPDPTAGCDRVRAARGHGDTGMAANTAGWTAVPADTSAWRLPTTSARYQGRQFLGCIHYNTDLYRIIGDNPQDTAAKSAFWAVGDPGEASLVFRGPDLADRSNLGELDVSLPPGHNAVFANSVTVAGVNHVADVSAFVTDRNCVPVDGATLAFTLSPTGSATVLPPEVTISQGVPAVPVTLTAGNEAVNDGAITATVVGGAASATGRGSYQVVGPADRLQIIVNPKRINIMAPDGNRAGITVIVRDEYGRDVADGTKVTVRIADGDPGQLAYDQVLMSGGQIEVRRVLLDKTAELITYDGYSQVPASVDPGITNGNLYLTGDVPGKLTISAVADGKSTNTNDPRTNEKTIQIVREMFVYLPMVVKNQDLRALDPPRSLR